MDSAKGFLIAAVVMVAVSLIAPATTYGQGTDESNWPVRTTFSMPVRIGSMVLAPGTYDFQLPQGTWARNVVAVYSVDQQCWLGMVMGVNVSRQDTSKMTGFTFRDVGANSPTELQYWFYPQWNRGIKFNYPRSMATGTMADAGNALSR